MKKPSLLSAPRTKIKKALDGDAELRHFEDLWFSAA
jgi:hypothetical protein